MMRRSASWTLTLVLLLVLLCAGLIGCKREPSATSSSLASSTSTTIALSGQDVLSRAVAWMEAEPTQVSFGPYSVTYGPSAKVAELTVSTSPEGEPVFSGTWWWSGDTDYYWQEGEGSTKHVTPEMAMSMTKATYPGADLGVGYLVMVRFLFDPHRLLTLSKVTNSSEQPDGSWKIDAQVSVRDLVALDLSDAELARYLGPVSAVRTMLEVEQDGTIRSMSTQEEGLDAGASTLVFARTSKAPTLPTEWDDLDQVTLQGARDEGWRGKVADAAPYVDFPVYFLGDSYQGRVVRLVHIDVGLDMLVEYAEPQSTGSTVARPRTAPDGYLLFEYSASNIPESEKRFVANKTLIKTAGQGDGAYTVYKTAKGLPGRSILVKKGETYISIDRIAEKATGDATEELLAAAAALRRAEQ